MNKFGAFVILAVAALAVSSAQPIADEEEAMTQAMLKTTDTEETAQLATKGLEAFNDFCISSRDYVLTDIKTRTNDLTSKAFSLVFNTAAEIGRESLDVQQEATEKLAAQLANPDAPVDAATDGVQKIIADGQEEMKDQNTVQRLFGAFKRSVSAVSTRVGQLVSDKLNALKSYAQPGEVLKALTNGCSQIASYEDELRSQFETYKQTSLGDDAAKYASLTLDKVPCATSNKIIRGEGICGLWRVAVNPMKKIFNA